MPLYDYECKKKECKHEFEENVPLSEFGTRVVKCPKCGAVSQRKMTAQRGPHTTWKNWRL